MLPQYTYVYICIYIYRNIYSQFTLDIFNLNRMDVGSGMEKPEISKKTDGDLTLDLSSRANGTAT